MPGRRERRFRTAPLPRPVGRSCPRRALRRARRSAPGARPHRRPARRSRPHRSPGPSCHRRPSPRARRRTERRLQGAFEGSSRRCHSPSLGFERAPSILPTPDVPTRRRRRRCQTPSTDTFNRDLQPPSVSPHRTEASRSDVSQVPDTFDRLRPGARLSGARHLRSGLRSAFDRKLRSPAGFAPASASFTELHFPATASSPRSDRSVGTR